MRPGDLFHVEPGLNEPDELRLCLSVSAYVAEEGYPCRHVRSLVNQRVLSLFRRDSSFVRMLA